MLKLSHKRNRDWNELDVNQNSNACSSPKRIVVPFGESPSKRIRNVEDSSQIHTNYNSQSRMESPFNLSTTQSMDEEYNNLEKYIPHKNRKKMDHQQSFAQPQIQHTFTPIQPQVPTTPQHIMNPQSNELKDKLFTFEEVKAIVQRLLAEKESSLRIEYDQILQEKLQEQFRNFTKFNEDYISRQLKQSDFSYLS